MNLEGIRQKADSFFEFPTDNKDHVTTTSAILFARHILEFADCSANCHQFHDSVIEMQKLTAQRCIHALRMAGAITGGGHHEWVHKAVNAIKLEMNLSD